MCFLTVDFQRHWPEEREAWPIYKMTCSFFFLEAQVPAEQIMDSENAPPQVHTFNTKFFLHKTCETTLVVPSTDGKIFRFVRF